MVEDPEKGLDAPMTKKDKIIIATILTTACVVLIILIASIAMFILEPKSGDTPESTFRSVVEGIDSGNYRKVFDASVFSLYMSYDDFMYEIGNDMAQSDLDIRIKNMDVIAREDIGGDWIDRVDDTLNGLGAVIGAVGEDSCLVVYTLNVTGSDGQHSQSMDLSGAMVCVKVDSKWYLVLSFYDANPTTPTLTMSESAVANGVKILVLSISDADVEWSEVGIIVSDGTNHVTWHLNTADLDWGTLQWHKYSIQPFGPMVVYCNVTDLEGDGVVDGNDYMELIAKDGSPGFSSATTYTVSLVYDPHGEEMGRIQFTG